MTVTVRLTAAEERSLRETVRLLSANRSEIVRKAIAKYCEERLREGKRRPYDQIAPWVGCAHSGTGDLSRRAHELYRKGIRGESRVRSR